MRAFRAFAAFAVLWTGARLLVLTQPDSEAASVIALQPNRPATVITSGNRDRLSVRAIPWKTGVWPKSQSPIAPIDSRYERAIPAAAVQIAATPHHIAPPLPELRPMGEAALSGADDQRSIDDRIARQPPLFAPTARRTRPITASGYVFWRGTGGQTALSGGPLLGGSQSAVFFETSDLMRDRSAGLELRGIARLSASGRTVSPDELAVGVSGATRTGRLVLGAALERRTRLRRTGRDALSARVSAGMFAALRPMPLAVSAYAQAGIVGINARDGFAEGAAVISIADRDLPLAVAPGVGAWAAIQPGVSRVDIGPSLDLPLVKGPATLTLKADWRFRVAGNATPGSGPTLTISSSF